MVRITHYSFTDYVLLLRRNVAGNRGGVLLLQDYIPGYKFNITQTAIQYTNSTELNHPAYSLDLAPDDYHLFSKLKSFLCGGDFEIDDEAIMIVSHYLEDLGPDSCFLEV